jgi:hypothetical protein
MAQVTMALVAKEWATMATVVMAVALAPHGLALLLLPNPTTPVAVVAIT